MDVAVARGENTELSELNRAFHFTIYRASGLDRLIDVLTILWNQSDGYRALYLADRDFRRRAQHEHHAILEVAKARDAYTVIRLLDEHRARAEASISDMLRTPEASEPAAGPPANS
jgi:DNA-binding GntR family transcriptional regulator